MMLLNVELGNMKNKVNILVREGKTNFKPEIRCP